MLVQSLNTTKLVGDFVVAGDGTNPNNVAPVVVTDIGQITTTALVAAIPLPAGANITDMFIYTTGTGTIWSGTPSWKVSVTTDGTKPATGNLVNGVASTISAFGQVQTLARSSWVTYQNGLDVSQGSVVYLYTTNGPFTTPDTATAYFQVEYYITP